MIPSRQVLENDSSRRPVFDTCVVVLTTVSGVAYFLMSYSVKNHILILGQYISKTINILFR
jgi:hypothetical protein